MAESCRLWYTLRDIVRNQRPKTPYQLIDRLHPPYRPADFLHRPKMWQFEVSLYCDCKNQRRKFKFFQNCSQRKRLFQPVQRTTCYRVSWRQVRLPVRFSALLGSSHYHRNSLKTQSRPSHMSSFRWVDKPFPSWDPSAVDRRSSSRSAIGTSIFDA